MAEEMKNWRELQNENNERLVGSENNGIDEELLGIMSRISSYKGTRDSISSYADSAEAMLNLQGNPTMRAAEAGYGKDRYFDRRIPLDVFMQDPNQARAMQQGWFSEFANGVTKFLPVLATTFLDDTAGLLFGAANYTVQGAKSLIKGEPFKPLDSFVNQPLSIGLNNFRDKFEEWVPNYRSNEEIADEDRWWKHMLSGNFLGDALIKNFGFTVGSVLAGAGYGKLLGAASGSAYEAAHKTAMAAAFGERNAEAAARTMMQGTAMNNPEVVRGAIHKGVEAFRKLPARQQLIGATFGSIGEARMEGLMAGKEFHDTQMSAAINNYVDARDRIVRDMMSNNPELFYQTIQYDEYGNPVSVPTSLTPEGEAELNSRMESVNRMYDETVNRIDSTSASVATSTFLPNVFLLSASNWLGYGRLFSGGQSTQARKFVKGSFGNYVGRESAGLVGSNTTGKFGNIVRKTGAALKTPVTEGTEEIMQKWISESAKNVADSNMAAFYNGQTDSESTMNLGKTLTTILRTGGDVFLSGSSWQEFVAGFLTGGLGVPLPHRVAVRDENGNLVRDKEGNVETKNKWSFNGGVVNALSEFDAQRKMDDDAAAELNKFANDEEKRKMWKGLVRHGFYEQKKTDALESNDKYAWHTANHRQMLSDIMMFAETGRLQDLKAFVDNVADLSSMSDEEVEEFKKSLADSGVDASNMTNEQLKAQLEKRAEEMKGVIDEYEEFKSDIDYLSLGTADEDIVNELIYTKAEILDAEKRYNDMIEGVISQIRPTIEVVAKRTDNEGNPTEEAKKAQEILSKENGMRTLFGGAARFIEGNQSLNEFVNQAIDDTVQEETLKTLEDWGAFVDDNNGELKTRVQDLQKLIRSRQLYYSRLFNPGGIRDFAKQFEDDKVTDDEAAESVEGEGVKEDNSALIEALKTITSRKEFMDFIINNEDKSDVLDEVIDKTPEFKAWLEELDDCMTFISELKEGLGKLVMTAKEEEKQYINTAQDEIDKYSLEPSEIDDDANYIDTALLQLRNTLIFDEKARGYLDKVATEILGRRKRADETGPVNGPVAVDKTTETKEKEETKVEEKPAEEEKKSNYKTVDIAEVRVKSGKRTVKKKLQKSVETVSPSFGYTEETKEKLLNESIVKKTDLFRVDSSVLLDSEEFRDEPELVSNGIEAVDVVGVRKMVREDGTAEYYNELKVRVKDGATYSNGNEAEDPRGYIVVKSDAPLCNLFFTEDFTAGESDTGSSVTVDSIKEKIRVVSDNPEGVEFLEDIASGKFPEGVELSEEDMAALVSEAQLRINELRKNSGLVETGDSSTAVKFNLNPDEVENPNMGGRHTAASEELQARRQFSFGNTLVSVYDYDAIKHGIRRLMERFSKPFLKKKAEWFLEHNVQEFVDSGALDKLQREYKSKFNHSLPIYFVYNPAISEENPFASQGTSKHFGDTLLAVEIDDFAYKALADYTGNSDKNSIDIFAKNGKSTLIEIEGKKYQIIGGISQSALKTDNEKSTFAKGVLKLTFTDSALQQYNNDLDKRHDKFYVAKRHPVSGEDIENTDYSKGERIYTTLNYIMSGRNETRMPGSTKPASEMDAGYTDIPYVKVPLRISMRRYKEGYHKKYGFVMMTGDGLIGLNSSKRRFPVGQINAPMGSVWMWTTEANGETAWTYITTARTGEFDFTSDIYNQSIIGKEVNGILDIIYAKLPEDMRGYTPENVARRRAEFKKKLQAMKRLQDVFYFGDIKLRIEFNDEGQTFLNVGALLTGSRSSFYTELKKQDVRFQIKSEDINDNGRMQKYIDADILTSEMQDFVRMGADFGVNMLDTEYGLPLEDEANSVAWTPGLAAHAHNSRTNNWDINIGNNSYTYNSDGTVARVVSRNKPGEVVEDKAIAAIVKAVYMALENKFDGNVYAVKTKGQTIELLSTNIDGVQVHLEKRGGKNGNIRPQLDDNEWERLISIAELVNNPYATRKKQREEDAIAQAEAEALKTASEQGFHAEPIARDVQDLGLYDEDSDEQTVSEYVQDNSVSNDDFNC